MRCWLLVVILGMFVLGCGSETGKRINSNLDKPTPPKAVPKK
jgi:hypothetical protein